jgi:hypothetical protein
MRRSRRALGFLLAANVVRGAGPAARAAFARGLYPAWRVIYQRVIPGASPGGGGMAVTMEIAAGSGPFVDVHADCPAERGVATGGGGGRSGRCPKASVPHHTAGIAARRGGSRRARTAVAARVVACPGCAAPKSLKCTRGGRRRAAILPIVAARGAGQGAAEIRRRGDPVDFHVDYVVVGGATSGGDDDRRGEARVLGPARLCPALRSDAAVPVTPVVVAGSRAYACFACAAGRGIIRRARCGAVWAAARSRWRIPAT